MAAITVDIGEATLSGGAVVNAPSFSESGWGTSLTVNEALAYAGAFSQGAGSTTAITAGNTLSLTGTASDNGLIQLGGGALTVTGTGSSLTIGAAGKLTGFGVVDSTTLTNSGEIVASGGTLTVQNTIAGTGGLEIDANGRLSLTLRPRAARPRRSRAQAPR